MRSVPFQLFAIEHAKSIAIRNRVPESTLTATSPPPKRSPPKPTFVVKSRKNPTNFSVPIQYEIVEVNSTTQLAEVDLTSDIDATADSTDRGDDEERPSAIEVIQINRRSTKVPRKILKEKLPKHRNVITSTKTEELLQIVAALQRNYFSLHSNIRKNNNLLDVHSSVRDFSIYMTFVEFNINMANVMKRMSKDKGVDELNRKSKLVDDVVAVEPVDGNNPSSTTTVNVSTKKNPKAQRSDNTRLMLLPETKEDINEKDLGE